VGLADGSASVFDNQFANQNCGITGDSTIFAAKQLICFNLGGIFPAICRRRLRYGSDRSQRSTPRGAA
jgi:hypothetical protein